MIEKNLNDNVLVGPGAAWPHLWGPGHTAAMAGLMKNPGRKYRNKGSGPGL